MWIIKNSTPNELNKPINQDTTVVMLANLSPKGQTKS